MNSKKTGSGGPVERMIYILLGFVLAAIGTIAAWYCVKWASDSQYIEYRWLYVTISAGLAFFMLRGALYTIFPEREDNYVELNTGGR
ncbi:MAG: hypothetical protein AAGF28_03085 [Pseudomonadota bacterium]